MAGFSKQILQVLSGYKFGTFDILTDDEVRQGIGKISYKNEIFKYQLLFNH